VDIFSLVGKITLDGINAVNQQLGGLEDKLRSAGQTMTQIGSQMSMKITAPLTALGLASFKMAGDFDQAFRSVNVMLGASTEEAAKYKDQILEISDATSKSAIDVTNAFYQIVSAGYRGADAIDILRVAMEGAVGGAADTVATTAALTKAMNIFQLEGVEGASRAMDTFFAIVDTGLLTFEEMAHAFPQAATMAAGLGIQIEEVGAALGTLSKVSGSTDEAATALNATFTSLVNPSEAMLALFEEWGVSTGPEAIERFGGLAGVLQAVQEATGGEVDKLSELFPNIRAIRAMLPLVTTNAEDFADALDTVQNSTGRTGEAFNEMAQGPGFQWQQMMTKLKNAGIELGDSIGKTLGPWLEKLIGYVKGAVEWFNNLSPGMQKAIIVAGVLVAALGPLLLILGQLSLGLGALIHLLPVLGVAFTTMTGPIGIIVAAIAGLIAIGVLVWKNWDTIKEKAVEIWGAITGFFSQVWDAIAGIFRNHWDMILAILFPAVGLPILIARNWGKIVEVIRGMWEHVFEFFRSIPEKVKAVFSTLKDIMLAPFRFAVKGIETAINWIIRQINKISVNIPDWVPLIGGKHFGFNIPEVHLPEFAHGGLIPEPTLLYGLKSMKPYAIAGEKGPETVSPSQPATITNQFNISELIVREEADVRKIAEELLRLQERKYRALGISFA